MSPKDLLTKRRTKKLRLVVVVEEIMNVKVKVKIKRFKVKVWSS